MYTYDANNLLIETKTPFDTVGDEIRYQVIALEYDTEGKVTKQTTSGGGAQQRITSYMYDNGLIVNTVNNAGQETVYEYDDAGRVVRTKVLRNEENGNKIYDITEKAYDKYDRVTEERGFLDQATVDAGLGALTLSESGQVVAKTTYRYDVMGNLTQLQSPMAFVDTANQTLYTTDYSYDNQSRLTQVSTYYQGGGEPQQITTNYAYDAVGNRVSVTDAKGNVTGYTYDTLNRVSSVTNANNMTTSYTYDLAGNKISETKPSGTWNYEYDSLNRLVVTRNPDGDVVGKVVYDENGNVTKRIDGNGTCLAQMTSLGMELNTSITSQI